MAKDTGPNELGDHVGYLIADSRVSSARLIEEELCRQYLKGYRRAGERVNAQIYGLAVTLNPLPQRESPEKDGKVSPPDEIPQE